MTALTPARLLLPLALILALPAAGKPAKTTPTARQELQALYNKMNAAADNKDVDGVYAYNDDDFIYIDKKGHSHDGSDNRQSLEQAFEVIDSFKGSTVILSFTGTNTEATVTVKDHDVVSAANGVTGRAIKYTEDAVSRDYWTYTADGWKRKRSRVISESGKFHKNF